MGKWSVGWGRNNPSRCVDVKGVVWCGVVDGERGVGEGVVKREHKNLQPGSKSEAQVINIGVKMGGG